MAQVQISIHAPSRERQNFAGSSVQGVKYQSTLPRGSDAKTYQGVTNQTISIHAPSRERLHTCTDIGTLVYFNPRSLAGATNVLFASKDIKIISIHAPSRERRQCYIMFSSLYTRFQSTLPRGSDEDVLFEILG